MSYTIKIMSISLLKPHEQIIKRHLEEIAKEIESDGFIDNPIIVDKKTLVILDGHHRYNAAKRLNLDKVPVCLVDYDSEEIRVVPFRDGEVITKDCVRKAGLSGKLLRPKSSRHIIANRPLGMKIPLESLTGPSQIDSKLIS